MNEYIKVTPTSEELPTAEIPAALESLHKLTNSDSRSIMNRLNPFLDTSPPTMEFLAISEGEDEPVEFYYSVDQSAHLETLEKRLKTIYPQTFDIARSTLDLKQKLIEPAVYAREEHRGRSDEGEEEKPVLGLSNSSKREEADNGTSGHTDGGRLIVEHTTESDTTDAGANSVAGDSITEPAYGKSESDTDSDLDRLQSSGSEAESADIGASLEQIDPVGVRWYGQVERKRDWMTTIKSFANHEPDSTEYDTEQPPLAILIDHLTEIKHPIVFQVVWQRKSEWTADAELRVEDLRDGRDTFTQRYIGPLFEMGNIDPEEERKRHLGTEARNRIERIESKHPKRTFLTNVRAVAVPLDDERDDRSETQFDQLSQCLNPLDGPFYGLDGRRLRSKGILNRSKQKRARATLENVLDAELVTGRGTYRPDLVLNADELANLTVVPSSQDLTVEGSRGTRSEQCSRNPLPRPHPDLMDEFREGMAIGYALDETGDPEDEPVCIPPSLLPTHYVRAATTGGGKSKALTNDKLSLYEQTDGPIILIDAKGDGLCTDYMRAHARRFGIDDFEENVLHFPIPEILPGFAFFNIESALDNGVRRIDAVQNKADHYEEILKMVMGEERFDRAVVAPTLIKYLIKALYDEEYGRENGRYRESADYFAHDQLEYVVDQLWRAGPPDVDEGIAPRSSNPQVQRRIDRQLQLDQNTFATVMGGVSNRLDYISQDEHLRQVFNNTDPRFDFRDIIDDRRVILFDLSGLRDESAKAMTGVILTELYNALRERGNDLQQKPDDYVVNLIIDEASSLAVSNIMNTLLEQGRSFRLSVGLSLQFPEQLDVKGGRETYLNVLNDVGSPIIGKIAVDDEIAKVMAHEEMDPVEFANRIRSLPRGEWITRLPSPEFGETGPRPFSLAPLPIPPGHPESDEPLTTPEEGAFQETLGRIHQRVNSEFGAVTGPPPSGRTPDSVSETFELESEDLDIALAKAVRTVQLRRNVREKNGWVPVQPVDQVLRNQFEIANESPPSLETLGEIRKRSRLLEVTLQDGGSEIVVRLTDDGETATRSDTGDVRSAGSDTHDDLLFVAERELSQYGFDVTVFTQDGSEKPDGRAVHPECNRIFDLEAESATIDKPVKILRNLERAREAGNIPVFIVEGSGESDNGLQAAARLENVLSSPVKELESGERRLYTTDSHITFDGGANARDGVTAVRPATGNWRRSVWTLQDGQYSLSDGNGTVFTTVPTVDSLSRSDVPAVYSYERTSDEYIVYEPNKRHRYENRSTFETEWVPIRRPFVPETNPTQQAQSREKYVITVIDRTDDSIHLYRGGQLRPIEDLVDEISAGDFAPHPPTSGQNPSLLPTPVDDSDSTNEASTTDGESSDESTSEISALPRGEQFEVFVDECIIQGEDFEVPKRRLFDFYQQWAESHCHEPYAKSWFGRKLSECVAYEEYRPTRDGERVRYYTGVTLSGHAKTFLDQDHD